MHSTLCNYDRNKIKYNAFIKCGNVKIQTVVQTVSICFVDDSIYKITLKTYQTLLVSTPTNAGQQNVKQYTVQDGGEMI